MKTLIKTLFFFLLLTQICFGQWVQVGLNAKTITDIAVRNETIFAVSSENGKLYRSLDNGVNWTMIVNSLVRDVSISPTGKVFIVKDSSWNRNNVFSSLDNGINWIRIDIIEQIYDTMWMPPIILANRIAISPQGIIYCGIIAGGQGGGQYIFARSSDDGITWSSPGICAGRLFDFRDQITISSGSYWEPGAIGGELSLSSDNGNNWTYLLFGYSGGTTLGYFSNGNIISDFYGEGIYIANVIDTTFNWTQISSLNPQTGQSFSTGLTEGMLIGTEDSGVFIFSDEGDSLGSRNEGLTNLNIQTLTLDNNGYVYAGTGNGIWRRPLTELVTSVDNEPTQPTEFILEQNYPNPFNPSTKISWQSPVGSQQTIKVFDVLGNEVVTLVNEYKPAGRYEVEFNTSSHSGLSGIRGLSSGVYLYQLRAGEFIQTRKMILLR